MGRLLNKALLWKEWRQNRWLLLLLLLFVIYTPIIDAVIFWVDTMMGMYRGLYGLFGSADPWSFKVTSAIKGLMVDESDGWSMGFNPLFPLAPVAVGLWGVLLIARERTPNTLEFLAAAPVSRREIAGTKLFFGAASIIGMMTVNLLFVLGIMLVAPVGYTWTEALFWFAYCVSYLLSLFSLGFLIAAVTGNWVATLGAVLLCSHLHWLLADTIRFFGLPMGLSDSAWERIRNGLEYIDLFFYLSYYAIGQVHMGHVAALFTAFLVLGMLSLRLFEKSPLEKNGQAFVFGSARLFWRFFIPLIPAALVGYVFSFNWISGLLSAGLAYMAGVWAAKYLMRQMEGNVIGAR